MTERRDCLSKYGSLSCRVVVCQERILNFIYCILMRDDRFTGCGQEIFCVMREYKLCLVTMMLTAYVVFST